MKVAIPKERRPNEHRVAASAETVKKLIGLGFDVAVEVGAGLGSSITDTAYTDAGATLAETPEALYADADVVMKVQRPLGPGEGDLDELALLPKGSVLISTLNPYQNKPLVAALAHQGVDAFAMELIPRITRAQSMDVLSSQANLAGYKAVLDGAAEFGRAFPMMMTAAGTVPPAKVFVMGAGVAGLQAIATAKRLGAVVSATDVRPATKEQVESLGGSFVAVEDEEFQQAQTAGGYAKEMSDAYKQKQAALVSEHIAKMDMVITTALIPGRPAPKLITADQVRSMKPGSVIVDLAVEAGGNCELAEMGKVVDVGGVKIVGHLNVPSRLAGDAAPLYARNLLNFITLLVDSESKSLKVDWEDEIVKGCGLTREGAVVHPNFGDVTPAAMPAVEPPAKPAAKKTTAKKATGTKATATKAAAKPKTTRTTKRKTASKDEAPPAAEAPAETPASQAAPTEPPAPAEPPAQDTPADPPVDTNKTATE